MRSGYTTGACATAAAKAALLALSTQNAVNEVEITLPLGQTARFDVATCEILPDRATCSVIKDAGDDPDVTNGAEIGATVEWSCEAHDIVIRGGQGVGIVTKPGLGLEIGAAAINPVPREMITRAVSEVLSRSGRRPCPPASKSSLGEKVSGPGAGEDGNPSVIVTIFVPNGEELAKKTLNARLGIIGGISILGTTGIVVPYSTSAYKACIVQALNVALASGCSHVVLTTGRRSEKFAQELLKSESLDLPEEAFIQVADFSGFGISQCAIKRFRAVTFSGMVGKLSKIAAGHMQTHVDSSRTDHAFLAKLAEEEGLPVEAVTAIRHGNTARQFAEIVAEHGATSIFSRICELAARNLAKAADLHIDGGDSQSPSSGMLDQSMEIRCIMVDFDGNLMGRAAARGYRPNHRGK